MILGLAVAIFALPSASDARDQKIRAKAKAEADLRTQKETLAHYQAEWKRYSESREVVESLERQLAGDFAPPSEGSPGPDTAQSTPPRPPKGVGELQWMLSKKLYGLAQQHGVRVVSVKYSQPSREGTKGTDLEALDVEFASLGVYSSLKPFMLALEGSELPFAVITAKLEESPEGARMSAVLRAFRKSSAPAGADRSGEAP